MVGNLNNGKEFTAPVCRAKQPGDSRSGAGNGALFTSRSWQLGMRVLSFLAVLSAAVVGVASPARGFMRFDFDQRYFIEPGYIIKDHTLVQADDGTLHLFYIRAAEADPVARALGHATSTDLRHWQIHPEVVPAVPGTWEESSIWAPHVIKVGSMWFMYYTGVNNHTAQAIGLATSLDLFDWTKYPGNPVYTPSTTWAKWNPLSWSNCRDPYVFEDGGTYYMTTTATTLDLKGAISFASSTDLVTWTDLGPLYVHPGPKAYRVWESTNLVRKDGVYHLFLTQQNDPGASWMSAPTMYGPWVYASLEPFDPGHATEVFQLGGQWMLSRHTTFTFGGAARYVIKFDELDWDDGPRRPVVKWRDPLEGWMIASGDAFYLQPVFWDNSLARGSDPSGFGGNSWIGTYELFTGPMQVGFPGLAAGDEPRGSIRSAPFTLTGNRISLRVGGGNDIDQMHVALYTAVDSRIQRRATGSGTDTMQEVTWNVGEFFGQQVFLEIADRSSGPWGHINVDEVVEFSDQSTDVARIAPPGLALYPNFPNPFNPTTRIAVDLPSDGHTRLRVLDVRGRLIRSLVAGRLPAGRHEVSWNGTGDDGRRVASGVYLYRLEFEGAAPQVRSMLLVK